jgi:hypothetical protein
VGYHDAALDAEDHLAGLEGPKAGEALLVHHPVAAGGHGQQVGVVRGRKRADEVERRALDELVVALGVLAGVEHQREPPGLRAAGQCLEAGGELADHRRELGHVGAVAGIGVRHQRDAAVDGDHQAQPDEAEIGPLLLGVAPLGDRGPVVGRVDPGGEVGHVQHQPRQVDPEGFDHGRHDPALDLVELRLADGVHRLPEAPVIEPRGG